VKISCSLLILINVCCNWDNIAAQSPADALSFAHQCFENKNYNKAIVEAKRVAFFFDSLKLPAYILIADCNKLLGLYSESLHYLSLSSQSIKLTDSIEKEIQFKKVSIFLLDNQPGNALQELLNGNFEFDSAYYNRKLFYLAFAYYQINDFSRSEKYLTQLLFQTTNFDPAYVQDLYKKAIRNSKKSYVIPAISSAILPGAGQLENKYYSDAAKTFLLNSLLIAVTCGLSTQLLPLDVFLIMYPFLRRYYLSGIFNARLLSIERQKEIGILIYNELLDYSDKQLNGKNM
jgi:hypothetical protein